jgi:hypothetical protein
MIPDAESGEITDVNPFLLTLPGYTHDGMPGKYSGRVYTTFQVLVLLLHKE